MAFPQVQSITPSTFSSDVTTHNVGMPATVNPGDLLLCIFTNDGSATVTTPGGWTAKGTQLSANSGVRQSIFTKIAIGNEDGGTVNFQTSASEKAVAQVYRITGAFQDASNGVATASSQDAGSEVNNPDPPNLAPGWGVMDILWIVSVGTSDSTADAVSSYPASYGSGTYTTSGTAIDQAQCGSAYRTAAASSENPGAFMLNDLAAYAAFTIAVRPQIIHDLEGVSDTGVDASAYISYDHGLAGSAGIDVSATGTVAGGVAELGGGAEVGILGTGEVRGLAALGGESQLSIHGAGSIIISDYNFKWSIDFLEARSDHGYPTVYVEVSSEAMPSGAFPEVTFFERRLLELPRLEEAEFGERFGIAGFQRVTLSLDNSDGLISSLDLTDAYVRLFFVSEAGDVREWKGRVTEWTLSHRCVISVEDMDAITLTEELPRRTLNDVVEAEKEADSGFEDTVVANDLGSPVPIIFGRAVKVPLLYIKADEAAREYDYIIGEGEGLGGGNFAEVFTVYREDQALDDIEGDVASAASTTLTLEAGDRRPDGWYRYWWVEITAGTGAGQVRHITAYDSVLNRITVNSSWSPTPNSGSDYRLREWRFFNGSQASPYEGLAFVRFKKRLGTSGGTDALYADVNGFSAETNVVRAVESVLSNPVWGLGLDVDSSSFNTAAGLAEIGDMLCEGAITDTTIITDILNSSGESQGLLSFRDMVLSKSDAVAITVDGPKSSAHSFGLGDETGWNNILTGSPEITHQHSGERVKNLKVRYRKNNRESDLYLHELERQSSAGGVDRALILPLVYDHETADRWLDYRRKRLAAAVRRMAVETGQEGGSVRRGERVTVSVPTLGLEGSAWEVAALSTTPAGSNSLTLVPYSAAPYTYVPVTDEGGELPPDESFDIPPDYTKTPPDPVTGASVSYTNDLSPEGQRQTFAVVTFTPPEDNFDHAVVSIRKNGATNWESTGSGTNRVRIKVTAGFFMDYLIVPYNVHGLGGLATTISNNLAPGDSTAPATPTGLAGTSKLNIAEWEWNKNSEADLAGYEYEIRTASSTALQQGGNGSVIASGFISDNRASYKLTDGNLTTSVTRHLRVRAIDHTAKATGAAGNKSTWTATVSATSGDIQRLDARNGDFSRQWSEERTTSISIASQVAVVTVPNVQLLTDQTAFIDASFTVQATGGAAGPIVHAGYEVRRGSTRISPGGSSASGIGMGTGTPRKGVAAVTVSDSPGAGTYTYSIVVFGVAPSGVTCQVDAANLTISEGRR